MTQTQKQTPSQAPAQRTAETREALKARARALREAGRSMAEVERETGVSVSTLHRWAAQDGWRACDLAEAALAEAMTDGAEDAPEAVIEELRAELLAAQEDGLDPTGDVSSETLRGEAERCTRAAVRLSRRGRIKEAEAALALAREYRALVSPAEYRERAAVRRARGYSY